MSRYDYFVSGRYRDKTLIDEIVTKLRDAGKRVYYFGDNQYEGDGIGMGAGEDTDLDAQMVSFEHTKEWRTNPTIRKMFEADMQGQRDSNEFIIILPAGLSAHTELGVAYGMGQKCYGIGTPEKVESLYLMFSGIYSDVDAFLREKVEQYA